MQNWAGNHEYTAARIHFPKSVDEICAQVARATKVRGLGTRHSFNAIADTTGELISTKNLDKVLNFDRDADRPTVTVEAGVTYGQLCPILHAQGYALHNLASLPHISVAGACATARDAACPNWLFEPTTNVSNVYFSFKPFPEDLVSFSGKLARI